MNKRQPCWHLLVRNDPQGVGAGGYTVMVEKCRHLFHLPGKAKQMGIRTKLLDLENQFEWKLPRDEGYETLAGFVLSRLQRIPRTGEGFSFEGRRFSVDEMDGLRIAKVKVEPEAEAA